jgi:hypothetical protein
MMRGLSPEHRHSDHASSGVSAAERAEVPASEVLIHELASAPHPPRRPATLANSGRCCDRAVSVDQPATKHQNEVVEEQVRELMR